MGIQREKREPKKVYKEPGPATKVSDPASVGEVVTVACKVPNGIILRLMRMVDMAEPVMGGGTRMVKQAQPTGAAFTVRGPAIPFGQIPSFQIIGGYALTEGIPGDFWDTWCEQNKDSDLLKNKMMFAHERHATVVGLAEDRKDIRSGLEPLNPNNDPRNPKSKNSNLGEITVGERV